MAATLLTGPQYKRVKYPAVLNVIQPLMTTTQFNGKWKSAAAVGVLDYNSNFSSWIDASAAPGYLTFTVALDAKTNQNIATLNIPTIDHYYKTNGYYSIYKGRFEFDNTEFRIWEYEGALIPVKIGYKYVDETLSLKIFKKVIRFEREE